MQTRVTAYLTFINVWKKQPTLKSVNIFFPYLLKNDLFISMTLYKCDDT